MERQRYISVPKDIKAMEDYDLGKDKPEQMIEWKLTETEFSLLWNLDVFQILNHQCEVMIDDFESDIITFDKLSKAKDSLFNLKKEHQCSEISRIYEMVEAAIEKGTIVAFDF